jgi:hypothetical protein
VDIEKRIYQVTDSNLQLIGRSDVSVQTPRISESSEEIREAVRSGYTHFIDYTIDPTPNLAKSDLIWLDGFIVNSRVQKW